MLYVIISQDIENSLALRQQVRSKHLARLNQLRDQGRLVLAGPNPTIEAEEPGSSGFTGSLVVAQFDSLQAAEHWAKEDPYVAAGIYQQVTVKPFIKVLP